MPFYSAGPSELGGGAIDPLPHPPDYDRNNSKTTFSFKRFPSMYFQTFLRPCLCSNTIVVILLIGVDKGQLISKWNSTLLLSLLRRKTFQAHSMVSEVELFSFVFWEN